MKQDGKRVIKFKAARIHYLSDCMFVTVAFLVAYAPYYPEKQPTFCDATTVTTQFWVVLLISRAAREIFRNTAQIWVVTRHYCGISVLFSQTSFRGENSGGVAK